MKQFLLSVLLAVTLGSFAQNTEPKTFDMKQQQQKLLFMENMGQITNANGQLQPNVLFSAKSNGMQLWLTATGNVYL